MANQINIKHQNREVFEKTFLYNVVLLCSFKDNCVLEKREEIAQLFNSTEWKRNESQNMLFFEKRSSTLLFGKNNFILIISKDDYQSFESIASIIDILDNVREVLKCKIETLGITKINRYNVKSENSNGENWMKKMLFSKEFIEATNENDTFTFDIENISTISKVQFNSKNSVDTIEHTIFAYLIGPKDFKSNILKLNNTIFDVWRWAISENIVDLMRRKGK